MTVVQALLDQVSRDRRVRQVAQDLRDHPLKDRKAKKERRDKKERLEPMDQVGLQDLQLKVRRVRLEVQVLQDRL